jgi:hypothetical protein
MSDLELFEPPARRICIALVHQAKVRIEGLLFYKFLFYFLYPFIDMHGDWRDLCLNYGYGMFKNLSDAPSFKSK